MRLSAFSVIKNEAQFIGYGLMSVLPYVEDVVYFDGGSTDGTLKLLDHIKSKYDPQGKIRVFTDKDFKDFKGDYVRVFNECMEACRGDYLWYLHPDMILVDPGRISEIGKDLDKWAFSVDMRSFAGEDMGLEIVKGRTGKWKTIMKRDFGLRYWGHYGDANEDMYFEDITGDEHLVHKDMNAYPYSVHDSGAKLWHFCECKPKNRRQEKMRNVLTTIAPGINTEDAVSSHPRVTLDEKETKWGVFEFAKRSDPLPEVFEKYREEFETVLKG